MINTESYHLDTSKEKRQCISSVAAEEFCIRCMNFTWWGERSLLREKYTQNKDMGKKMNYTHLQRVPESLQKNIFLYDWKSDCSLFSLTMMGAQSHHHVATLRETHLFMGKKGQAWATSCLPKKTVARGTDIWKWTWLLKQPHWQAFFS